MYSSRFLQLFNWKLLFCKSVFVGTLFQFHFNYYFLPLDQHEHDRQVKRCRPRHLGTDWTTGLQYWSAAEQESGSSIESSPVLTT